MENFKIKFHDQVRFQRGEKKTLIVNLENRKNLFIGNEFLGYIEQAQKEKLGVIEFIQAFEDEDDVEYAKDVIDYIDACSMWEDRTLPLSEKIINLSLDITNECNLRCKHCCVSAGEHLYGVDLSKEQIKEVLNKIYEFNPNSLSISGGEPLVRTDFKEIIEDISTHYTGKMDLLTNGTLIDEDMAGFIAEHFDSVSVSLDGIDDKTTAIIRGKGVFQKTINGIKNLRKYGVKKLEATMVICKENEKYIKQFKELCESLGVKDKLRILEPGGRIDEHTDEIHYVDPEIHPKGKLLEEYLKHCLENGFNKIHPETCACQAARREFLIDFKGDIYPCASLADVELKLGNILEIDDIKDYFINRRYISTEGYKEFEKYLPYNVEGCKECNKNLMCYSCVRTVKDRVASGELHKDCKFNYRYYDLHWKEV